MSEQETEKRAMPPYVTFKGFINFINMLRGHPLPHQIDRSLMTNLSGSGQSTLLACLRSLVLINPASEPTSAFEKLVAAEPESAEYKEALKGVLPNAYPFLVDGTLDIARATTRQLEEVFRAYGVSGSTINKAISFFIAAAKECGITVSSHITIRKAAGPRKNGTPSKTKSTKKNSDNDALPPPPPPLPTVDPKGIFSFEVPIMGKPSAKVSLPEDMTRAEWTLIKTIIDAQAGFVLAKNKEGEE